MYVDDADVHCDRAREAGAFITAESATQDYGDGYWADRSYEARDPEGRSFSRSPDARTRTSAAGSRAVR